MITKFISIDLNASQEILFNILDVNKDKKVCEIDLFYFIQSLKSKETQEIFMPDILIILQHIEKIRLS